VSDLELSAIWLAVLVCGLGGAIAIHMLGVASTYVRDLLHVGAGVWVLGWPHWHGRALPVTVTIAIAVATACVPLLAPHNRLLARLVRAVTGDDEHWLGLSLYTLAFAALTAAGLGLAPLPAAAGLLALSFGDGLGGAFGRRFGRHGFRAPGGKRKSFEGTVVVALGAAAGAAVAAHLFGQPIAAGTIVLLGAVAAVVEALAPRGTDNLLVPAAVWLAALLVT
jgi:dolichol kinase